MKSLNRYRFTWRVFVISIFVFAALLVPEAHAVEGDDQSVSIDFNNVDINVFIKFISELTGRNFVVDPRVKGNVTINSPGKISVQQAYRVFQSVLELHGFTTIASGEITKIVPSSEARSKNVRTLLPKESGPTRDQIVTQLIPLKYANATEVRRLLAPLISKSSVLLAYPQTNTIIVTDVYSNIRRLQRIIRAIDQEGVGREIAVLPLEHSDAGKLVKLLQATFRETPRPGKKTVEESVRFMADERTNTIVILASENDVLRIQKLVAMLDKETPRGNERIRVYYLEHATAEDLAKVLQEVPAKTEKAPQQGKKTAAVISDKTRVMADKATNSLIIMAEKDDFDVLEEIIQQLDIPRAMVFIECLIMEVNVDKDLSLGTEWIAAGTTKFDEKEGVVGGGFSGADDYNGIGGLLNPLTGVGGLPTGFSIGVFSELLDVGGIKFPGIAVLPRVFAQDKDVNILSTPQILTTDNEEASITVGKNVPFQTKSGSTDVESFNTFEYRDVGITLKITPQISKDRMVRLKIFQNVERLEDVSEGLAQFSDRPTTLKRTIETTVIVRDGNTLVIGGLIDEAITDQENKVPCLGEIPGLGWLFKARADSSEKTNLYVFLTPHVVKSPAEAKDLYQKKKVAAETVSEGRVELYDSGYKIRDTEKSDFIPFGD